MSHARAQRFEPSLPQDQLKTAMRSLAGGVSIITAGVHDDRTGLTVTTAVSLSIDPPTMMVSVNRAASAFPIIRQYRHFGVNILGTTHEELARRFAGAGGVKGVARYHGADWMLLGSGASGLRDALAVIDCEVDEIIERHSHAIIIGAVRSVTIGNSPSAEGLVYAQGSFSSLSAARPSPNLERTR